MEPSILNALEDVGLSKGEAKVYATLLELGESKVGAVIEKAGLVSSVVHMTLNKLVEKGLISYIKKGKIKFYQALPPKQVLAFVQEKERKLSEYIPMLENKQRIAMEKEYAEVFEGIKGVKNMLNLLISDSKKGDEYLFFSTDIEGSNKEIQDFWATTDRNREEKGLEIRGIARPELKPLYVKRKLIKMRYTGLPILASVTIHNGKVSMLSFEKRPVGYLLHSKQMFEIYKKFFEETWKLAKK